MTEPAKKTYAVEIREYERGFGSKLHEIEYFHTEQEALQFEMEYNFQNETTGQVPKYYTVAEYVG